jgi:hypothetical protein
MFRYVICFDLLKFKAIYFLKCKLKFEIKIRIFLKKILIMFKWTFFKVILFSINIQLTFFSFTQTILALFITATII